MPHFPFDAPGHYDDPSMKISVKPDVMHDYAHRHMPVVITSIVDSWELIGKTWEDLKLGWSGDTADAAKEFNDRLQKVQREMFGFKDEKHGESEPGVLNLIRAAVVQASANYDNAEDSVTFMFDRFDDELLKHDDGEPESDPNYPIAISFDGK